MKILITGATGFVGKHLTRKLLEKNHSIIVLSRDPEKAKAAFQGKVEACYWDAQKEEPLSLDAWAGVQGVVHLAGDSIAQGRWTEAVKKSIYESRVSGTEKLVQSLEVAHHKLDFFIGASATGIYDNGFLATVCKDWESAMLKADASRKVIFRFGVVLGKAGGALSKMLPVFRLGMGGPLGSGKQWMSWVHLEDLCEMIVSAVEDRLWNGTYDAVSPEPVTNEVFTKVLGQALHRPVFFKVPEFALKLALGDMAEETLLASQKILPKRLVEQGFVFRYPNIKKALEDSL